jgi:pimeloyl-ACP methyl ester carboxylesterase
MPEARNGDISIHYEVDGEGPPLILQHGFRDSGAGWQQWGYIEKLAPDFQVIRIDARGHGKSSKPHDPELYTIDKPASDVVAVADHLGLEKPVYWGYSMGGRIGFALLRHYPDRFQSFIIGGASPLERRGGPGPAQQGRPRMLEILEQGMDAVLAWRESQGRPLTPEEKEVLMANDHLALAAVFQNTLGGAGFMDVLPTIKAPCMFYGGSNDPGFFNGLQDWTPQVPRAKVVTLEGLDHGEAFDRSDLVVPQVKEFLKSTATITA